MFPVNMVVPINPVCVVVVCSQTEAGVAEAENDKNEPKREPKKRVLPAWMTVPIAAPKNPTTTTTTTKGIAPI